MKKILITGKKSYVGTSVKKWLEDYSGEYLIDSISLRNESWKEIDYSNYDVVFHVAGIAHIKETEKNADLYYRVNRDLAYKTAEKAKNEGVKQFIFLSSMSVYGIQSGVIDKNSALNPQSNYGKSKLEAEGLISSLIDDQFKVAIIRPPMIYGKECKGNYVRLAKLAKKVPVFPNINNNRSMLYIDNLSEFVRLLIEDCTCGLFFPQNEKYICTSEMVKLIAEEHGKKIRMTNLFNPFIKVFRTATLTKIFGDLVYEETMSRFKESYIVKTYKESLKETESRGYGEL
ncbi:NAD-dependent epimerase/dehydratase family protein [Bacillus haikouensis]|nr:NAD-dependent epimerase/dehydratase family protein [Bacillus haikouensis]